jgi:hypothetical protein
LVRPVGPPPHSLQPAEAWARVTGDFRKDDGRCSIQDAASEVVHSLLQSCPEWEGGAGRPRPDGAEPPLSRCWPTSKSES